MKKGVIIALACVVLIGAIVLIGKTSHKETASGDDGGKNVTEAINDKGSAAETADKEGTTDTAKGEEEAKPFDGVEISFLRVSNGASEGCDAVIKAAEEKLGIKVKTELLPGGEDGDNVVKTRLASGDMADVVSYNCGSLLASLNPSEYFEDLTADFADKIDKSFLDAASVDGVLYGIPATSYLAGAVLYNTEMYEKYNLEIPKTWDEFLANCDVLKAAGETAVLGTGGDSWTCQVPFLGDHYNVVAAEPDFVSDFEAGKVKYADTEVGVKSFQKIEDLIPYLNEDHMATTYDDGCDIMMEDGAAHWIILTNAVSNMYELYGDKVNKIGCFAVPGEDAENCGLTVWAPNAIYMNKNAENADAVKAFLEFYISDEGLDIYTSKQLPSGPYCVKGYDLPENCYASVKQMKADYFDTGLNMAALEFQTAVKGSNCASICQELISGQTHAKEAAAKYDEDCRKQAVQLGLDWK